MGKNLLVGVGSKARKVKALYVGVGGKARKVKKVYVGVGGKARLVYQSYIPVTGISLSWELGAKESYDRYPDHAFITATLTPSNATNPIPTWTCEEGLILSKTCYDKKLGTVTVAQNQIAVTARTGSSYDGTYKVTASADGKSVSVNIYNYRHKDRDGDWANGIKEIAST